MNLPDDVNAACWPQHCLGECIAALLHCAGLTNAGSEANSFGLPLSGATHIGTWIARTAEQLGCDTITLETSRRDLRNELLVASPCLLALDPRVYLAIVGSRRGRLVCLRPDGETMTLDLSEVCCAIAGTAGAERRERLADLVAATAISEKQRRRVIQALMDETDAQAQFHSCWAFRNASGRPASQWLRNSGVIGTALSLLLAHSAQYGLWLISWALLGTLSFAGHMDRGWLLAWALLLATVVPCRALATWLQGVIPIVLGGELKRRILQGALKLAPDEIRKSGIGSFLGQAFEAEALETLALGGGIVGLLAVVDLGLSAFVLGRLAILLAAWFAIAVAVGVAFLRRFESWSGHRLEMTHDLVEAMVGRRTRLAQLHPRHWHKDEDDALFRYLSASCDVDRTGALLVAAVPRGWLLASVAFLAPQII